MNKTIIIAEAGVNHNGNLDIARKMIEKAAEAGADYIKYQTFTSEKLVSREAKKAEYQLKNDNTDADQLSLLKNLELSRKDHYELQEYARINGIKFLSSGFDADSIDFLDGLGIELFKIPSGEITNKPYLQHVASKNKPVILSTGMATMTEIQMALAILNHAGLKSKNITVLHCNTEYPTPMKDVNLKAMINIQRTFDINIGYSDHTLGIEIPIAAVALGATVIEKHFTLDRSMPGPDHQASLEPEEFKNMVMGIRNVEEALQGDGIKKPSNSELRNINIVRRSIYVNKSLDPGHIIQPEDLIMLRPGTGISPMDYDKVIGNKIVKKVISGTKLKWEHFK